MLPLNPILKDAFEEFEQDFLASNYIPIRKLGIYWIQVHRAATATVEISLCTR